MSTQTDQIETDQNLVELHVQPLNDELTEKVLTAFNGLKVYLTRINANHEDLPIVEKSTPLFSFVVEDEKDEKTSKNKIIEISPDFHDNRSNIEQSGKNYIASIDGIFVIENDRPKIIPVDLHGSGDVKVSENSMNVYVDIYPSIGDNPIPSLDDIVEKILKLNVTAEIDKELLAQKLSEVENDKIR
ncbi:MAG: hypothetical protein KDC88_17005, partial [Ignavibacteriae bacterium]|nr:hypothetical protein [Ignavibacteriota bacterium]